MMERRASPRAMTSAQVTFKIVGPMKRSTFPEKSADPVDESINDILHWTWSTRLQIRRLAQSVRSEFKALSWREGVRRRRRFSNTSYDEHILLVAAANLERAITNAPRALRAEVTLPAHSRRALWLLRNIYEHWDELRRVYRGSSTALRGAALKLKTEFPNADPWSFTIDPKRGEIVLANVVPRTPMLGELRALEHRLLKVERKHRRTAPSSSEPSPSTPASGKAAGVPKRPQDKTR